MKEETVWVSRRVSAWDIFSAVAVAETASILLKSLFLLMSCISFAWTFRSIVFEG